MRFKKSVQRISALAMVIGFATTSAFALQPPLALSTPSSTGIVMPRWVSISDIYIHLDANGKTLNPEVLVEAKSSTAKITGTLYLERYSGGRWVRVTSWSISGTGSASLSKTYTGVAGNEYRTRVAVTVSGEKAEATSASCSV